MLGAGPAGGVGGVGIVVGGIAVYFHLDKRDTTRRRRELLADCTLDVPCEPGAVIELDDRITRDRQLATMGYLTAGAAIAGGVALFLLGRPRSPVTVVPTTTGAIG